MDETEEMAAERPNRCPVYPGKVAITPQMALRLGKFCGNGPGVWLRMQQAHDLWQAERSLKEELDRIPSHGHEAA